MVNQFRYVTMYLCLKLCNRVFLCVIVCKGLGWGKIRNQGNYRSRPGFPSVGENFYPTRKIQKARNPCVSKDSGHIQAKKVTTLHCIKYSVVIWRRVRDLNPSSAYHANTISSRAPSTTQPTLHGLQRCVVHNVGYYISSLGFCQAYFETFFEQMKGRKSGGREQGNVI